jgi:ribosomal protein S12 methylthiotransferase accessory factor
MEMEIRFPGGLRVDAAFDDFVVKTDQSIEDGGEASAPNPFTLFLAAIGTCAGTYVLEFCKKRGLATEDIYIRQRMDFDAETHLVSSINLDIHLPPDFPKKYVPAIVRSAQLCTVKKHLENPPTCVIQAHVDTA